MPDTQWPRYQVFVQESHAEPHQDAGSVHATDPELALQNARDVFARRPQCVSMWVAPAACIYSRTAQELEELETGIGQDIDPGGVTLKSKGSEGKEQAWPAGVVTYCVFNKKKSAGTQTFAGLIEAASPAEALSKALSSLGRGKRALAWWVIPDSCVTRSDPDQVESMYAPAREKTFRLSTDFHTVSAMRTIRSGQETRKGRREE